MISEICYRKNSNFVIFEHSEKSAEGNYNLEKKIKPNLIMHTLLNKIPNVEECNATDDDSSNVADYIIST